MATAQEYAQAIIESFSRDPGEKAFDGLFPDQVQVGLRTLPRAGLSEADFLKKLFFGMGLLGELNKDKFIQKCQVLGGKGMSLNEDQSWGDVWEALEEAIGNKLFTQPINKPTFVKDLKNELAAKKERASTKDTQKSWFTMPSWFYDRTAQDNAIIEFNTVENKVNIKLDKLKNSEKKEELFYAVALGTLSDAIEEEANALKDKSKNKILTKKDLKTLKELTQDLKDFEALLEDPLSNKSMEAFGRLDKRYNERNQHGKNNQNWKIFKAVLVGIAVAAVLAGIIVATGGLGGIIALPVALHFAAGMTFFSSTLPSAAMGALGTLQGVLTGPVAGIAHMLLTNAAHMAQAGVQGFQALPAWTQITIGTGIAGLTAYNVGTFLGKKAPQEMKDSASKKSVAEGFEHHEIHRKDDSVEETTNPMHVDKPSTPRL